MSALDTKFTISIRAILKVLFILIFLPGGFLLGRYMFPADVALFCLPSSASDSTESDEAVVAAPTAQAEVAVKAAPITGAVTSAANVNTSKIENKTAKKDEKIVTSYGKVALEFTRAPAFEWKKTYGKIITFYYKIVNGENGAIAPDRFSILVKGYDADGRPTKIVDVPEVDTKILSGETREHGVDAGITYRAPNVDTASVEITMNLIDEQGALIATTTKSFNLQG